MIRVYLTSRQSLIREQSVSVGTYSDQVGEPWEHGHNDKQNV
jgi:hypothetical protein